VAKRNYYPLATVAIKKKCLPLTQKIHNVLYLKIKTVKSKQKFMKKMYKTRLIRIKKNCACVKLVSLS
jgi:hypothetical protein